MSTLRAFACGSTMHGVHQLLRGAPRERRVFPAGVFLYEDDRPADGGPARRVLYDTGYAPEPWHTGVAGWAYRRLLPPTVPPGSTIGEQLDPAAVTHVVLSHLHPDHIGGLAAFPDATVVVTEAVRRTMESPRLRDGVLRGLLPPTLAERLQVVPDSAFTTDASAGANANASAGASANASAGASATATTGATPTGPGNAAPRLQAADLFGDGTYLLVDLPGHAAGHVGALVEHRVLLAGDAAWSRDLLGQEHRIRPVPRAVAHDATAQSATARRLLDLEHSGVRLLFSHDEHRTGIDLLGADRSGGGSP